MICLKCQLEFTCSKNLKNRKYCSLECAYQHRQSLALSRFWSNVKIDTPEKCWIWSGNLDRQGYGKIGIRTLPTRGAHRIAYMLTHSCSLSRETIIRHTCDNPPCCNPNHLKTGTTKDNINDKILRHRTCYGSTNRGAKLSLDDVKEIIKLRQAGIKRNLIAQQFSINANHVSRLLSGSRWKKALLSGERKFPSQNSRSSWRKAIFERDGFKCQRCNDETKNEKFYAHHIKSWKDFPHLRFDINNGITLCYDCHRMEHTK